MTVSPVILASDSNILFLASQLSYQDTWKVSYIGIYSSSVKKTSYKDVMLFSLQIFDLSCLLILQPSRLVASCFDAFQEYLGIAIAALLFAVHISSRVSLFPSFISPVIIDISCYWFARGEFPSFEGYMFTSNNLFNHTINEIGLFLTFLLILYGFFSLLVLWFLRVFFSWWRAFW